MNNYQVTIYYVLDMSMNVHNQHVRAEDELAAIITTIEKFGWRHVQQINVTLIPPLPDGVQG